MLWGWFCVLFFVLVYCNVIFVFVFFLVCWGGEVMGVIFELVRELILRFEKKREIFFFG